MGRVFSVILFACCIYVPSLYSTSVTPACNYIIDPVSAQKRPIRVLYFVPDGPVQSFWYMHHKFANAVAQDLGIELNLHVIDFENRDRFSFLSLVEETLREIEQPDYVVAPFYLGGEENILSLFESKKLPFFTVNTSLNEKSLQLLGLPRIKYKYWLGHMTPDDLTAGYKMTQYMMRGFQRDHDLLFAIGGLTNSTVSKNREFGLQQYLHENYITISPVIHTDWRSKQGFNVTQRMFKRSSKITHIWTASADIVDGVAQYLEKYRIPRNIKIGTFDWSPLAVDLIRKGVVDISYGGHFMEGGWTLVLLLDHANGLDFSSDIGTNLVTELKPLTEDNIQLYGDAIAENDWSKINFKSMSKCYSPQNKTYHFDIDMLLKDKAKQ